MSQSAVLSVGEEGGGGTVAEWERGAQMKVKTNKSFNPLSHGGMRGSAGCDSTFPSPGDIWRTGLGAPTAIMIFYASPFFFLFFFCVHVHVPSCAWKCFVATNNKSCQQKDLCVCVGTKICLQSHLWVPSIFGQNAKSA